MGNESFLIITVGHNYSLFYFLCLTFLKEAELAAMTVRIAQQPPRRLFLFLHWPD